MKETQTLLSTRKQYINLIKSELMGPGSEFQIPDKEHELISSSPINRYSTGILFPHNSILGQDNDETISSDDENITTADDKDTLSFDESFEAPAEAKTDNTPKQRVETISEHQDESSDAVSDGNLDEEISMSSQYRPSSMGLSFVGKGDTDTIIGRLDFATYKSATIENCAVPYEVVFEEEYAILAKYKAYFTYNREEKLILLVQPFNRSLLKNIPKSKRDGNVMPLINRLYSLYDISRSGYIREPHSHVFQLSFRDSDYIEIALENEGPPLNISAVRTLMHNGDWSLTVMLINKKIAEAKKHPKVSECVFQPRLSINTADCKFTYVDSSKVDDYHSLDQEELSLEMQYRNKQQYATGLGVSAEWDISRDGTGKVWSEFLPEYEVPSMSFDLPENDLISKENLSMKLYSDLTNVEKEAKLQYLKNLVDLYRQWVDVQKSKVDSLPEKYKRVAFDNIINCEKAYERMYVGIEILDNNNHAYSSFELANRAMYMQRTHLQLQSDTSNIDRYPEDEDIQQLLDNMDYYEQDDHSFWRPFQLAFILMDIPSIVTDDALDRDLIDLIWFPTGGGKTEAYLGLTAFTIFYRRLKYPDQSDGTTVIMRYTLRLLTAQQFTRASTLICACEYIRNDVPRRKVRYPAYVLGDTPITIGLWIGGAHTPNRNDSAKKDLDMLMRSDRTSLYNNKQKYSNFQVIKCPWCGTKIVKDTIDNKLVGRWGYMMRKNKQFRMSCTHESCFFNHRLPIQVVDEELYKEPPTLLFGTVDKFAMLAWEGKAGAFFGVGSEHRPPELIIQDELHLISGALGTIVGLYETAMDGICKQKGVKPKIIASTATIRRASEQCSALYNREVHQFPPPGIDAEDSFFARESVVDYEKNKFGRLYIGVMPSGRTKASTEIRLLAALLEYIEIMDLPSDIKDKFWTVTAYFNSLRDLGKASTMVDDDIKDFIRRIAFRHFNKPRIIYGSDELTSRITTTTLNETLDKLEKVTYSTDDKNSRYPSNILLATNMISVGIDIPRLNVMTMLGQPKLTSEYIQASSRIGRRYPGVIFVQYDATKSRDRSHYERFKSYHDSFYRYVEPTGVTPFSKPARQRALHAVVISMIRQIESLWEDNEAGGINFDEKSIEIQIIEDFIVSRIQDVNGRMASHLEEDYDSIRTEITDVISEWKENIQQAEDDDSKLYFGKKYMINPLGENDYRLMKQFGEDSPDPALETLTSMRNVDAQVTGDIIIWEESR